MYEKGISPSIRESLSKEGVRVLTPCIPEEERANTLVQLSEMLCSYIRRKVSKRFVSWYYTPMACRFTHALTPAFCVYDCMDELANFRDAPRDMRERERELMVQADIVFTGGYSLYEKKSEMHRNVFPFRSSIDREHFAKALQEGPEPLDIEGIPRPRAGYYGVIDERFDVELLEKVARTRSDWQFIILGPAVKLDRRRLPKGKNLYYIGQKSYEELPAYLAHWDTAILPIALNDSTRFISPTKIPEYLAAMKPVISTPIRDVCRDYGHDGLVFIAHSADEFSALLDQTILQQKNEVWRKRVANRLAGQSWDATWDAMVQEMEKTYLRKEAGFASIT